MQRLSSRFGPLLLGALSLIAGLTAWSVSRWLYPLGSINHDEQMYVFSARLLRQGHVSLPTAYAPFRPWASGVSGGKLVLKYTPVWPAVLSLGTLVGSVRLAQAAVAAAAVALIGVLGREVFGRWREGLLAAVIVMLSPLFISQSGTALPYVFQLVLDLAVVVLVLGAMRRWPDGIAASRSVVVRLILAGAVWGVACFARPYDALLLVVPIVAALVVSMRHRIHNLSLTVWWTALGACAPIVALLSYNAALMGNPLRSPFLVTGSSDQLGFGARGVFPTSTFTFTPGDGWLSFERNLVQFPGWLFGGALLVALAVIGLWRHRSRGPDVWVIAGIAVTFAVGYAFFWSPYSIVALWPGARTMGPFYHLPILIPVALFGAAGIVAIVERSHIAGALTICALVAITLVTISPKLERNREVTRQNRAVQELVDGAHLGRAVLFMDDRGAVGFESAAPFLENTPALDQPVLYAVDDGANDFAVLDRFPDRTVARMRTEYRPGDPFLHPTRFIERLDVEHGPEVTLRFRIVNTSGAPTVTTTLQAGAVLRAVVLDTNSKKGEAYDIAWTIQAADADPGSPMLVRPPGPRGSVDVEADLTTPGHPPDRYQREYPYVMQGDQLRILTPGRGRYLLQYGKPTWLDQDVTATLAETR